MRKLTEQEKRSITLRKRSYNKANKGRTLYKTNDFNQIKTLAASSDLLNASNG